MLVHMCCGPCSIYPLKELLKGEAEVWGYFYNPNIHPYSEFKKRLGAVRELARLMSVDVVLNEDYKPALFIRKLKESLPEEHRAGKMPPEGPRCTYCYSSRIEETARAAREGGFDAFSSSLLYSKYQNHEEIKSLGLELSERYGVEFIYRDFRDGWQEGIDFSKEMGLYRQKYCGCIYSRIERFSKKKKKKAQAG